MWTTSSRRKSTWSSNTSSTNSLRPENCAVMGQGGSAEGRAELRRTGTRLVGTVAFFPEKYGERIIALALDILHKKPVPPAVFVDHQLLTPTNVDHYYPNDLLNSPLNRRT